MTPQIPLGSGFGPRTTARDVLGDRRLDRLHVVINGGSAGVGLETTRACALTHALLRPRNCSSPPTGRNETSLLERQGNRLIDGTGGPLGPVCIELLRVVVLLRVGKRGVEAVLVGGVDRRAGRLEERVRGAEQLRRARVITTPCRNLPGHHELIGQ